jgi:hypothetical protein
MRRSAGRRGSPSEPGRRRFQYITAALITAQISARHPKVMTMRLTTPNWVPMCVLIV